MPKGNYLTQNEQGCISALEQERLSISAISHRVSLSRKSIGRYLSNPDGYGNRKPTRGNAWLSLKSHRPLLQEASKGHQTSSQLQRSLQLPISRRRIQQIITGAKRLKYGKGEIGTSTDWKAQNDSVEFFPGGKFLDKRAVENSTVFRRKKVIWMVRTVLPTTGMILVKQREAYQFVKMVLGVLWYGTHFLKRDSANWQDWW